MARYNVLVVGSSGIGKSTFLNVLAGGEENLFAISRGPDHGTRSVVMKDVEWQLDDNGPPVPVTLIDTPGVQLLENNPHMYRGLLPNTLSLVIFLMDWSNQRWDDKVLHVLVGDLNAAPEDQVGIFGKEILDISILVFSHVSQVESALPEGDLLFYQKKFGREIPYFLVDCKPKNRKAFETTIANIKLEVKTNGADRYFAQKFVLSQEMKLAVFEMGSQLEAYWTRVGNNNGTLEADIRKIMEGLNREDKTGKRFRRKHFVIYLCKGAIVAISLKVEEKMKEICKDLNGPSLTLIVKNEFQPLIDTINLTTLDTWNEHWRLKRSNNENKVCSTLPHDEGHNWKDLLIGAPSAGLGGATGAGTSAVVPATIAVKIGLIAGSAVVTGAGVGAGIGTVVAALFYGGFKLQEGIKWTREETISATVLAMHQYINYNQLLDHLKSKMQKLYKDGILNIQ